MEKSGREELEWNRKQKELLERNKLGRRRKQKLRLWKRILEWVKSVWEELEQRATVLLFITCFRAVCRFHAFILSIVSPSHLDATLSLLFIIYQSLDLLVATVYNSLASQSSHDQRSSTLTFFDITPGTSY